MTVSAQCLVEPTALAAAEAVVFTSPANTRTIIDKATATNTTGAAINLTAKMPSAASLPPTAGNTIMSGQVIGAGATYTCPEIVGHVLAAGDELSLLASAVGLTFRMSGRLVVG